LKNGRLKTIDFIHVPKGVKMEIEEYSYKLVKDFMINFNDLYEEMKESSHYSVNENIFSDYHLESVWTHTLMVYSHMIPAVRDMWKYESDRAKRLLMASLLHDIGKPSTRKYKEDKDKYVFYGHDSVSTIMAPEIIDNLDSNMSVKDKKYILGKSEGHSHLAWMNAAKNGHSSWVDGHSHQIVNGNVIVSDVYEKPHKHKLEEYVKIDAKDLASDGAFLSLKDIENMNKELEDGSDLKNYFDSVLTEAKENQEHSEKLQINSVLKSLELI
jgi:putative nucleotidyltransferase with HDIG domain